DSDGNLSVCGLITMIDSGADFHEDEVFVDSDGSISALGVVIVNSGAGEHDNEIFIESDGNITIGLAGVAISDCGAGEHFQEIFTDSDGAIFIKGSVTVIDKGTGFSEFDIESEEGGGDNNITICGNVFYSNALNKTGDDDVFITADTSDD